MTQEALKMALEALENHTAIKHPQQIHYRDKAITAIKEALAQTQEPVAWRTFDGEGGYDYRSYEDNESYADDWSKRNPNHVGWVHKLYTHSQRTWVGLTDEESHQICNSLDYYGDKELVQLIESKLKEKNNG